MAVICGAVILTIGIGARQSFGIFQKPIAADLRVGRELWSFANALAKLPPEDLNEDVDASRLDAALRKRVGGLDEEAADAELAKDRDLLQRWLKDKPDYGRDGDITPVEPHSQNGCYSDGTVNEED